MTEKCTKYDSYMTTQISSNDHSMYRNLYKPSGRGVTSIQGSLVSRLHSSRDRTVGKIHSQKTQHNSPIKNSNII
ncbi:Uncharacterised protein [Yersinia mollaretii]|uniref:Uncharacterized protein n=1 Tax=Yersinia mollaretii TaxID=33060 RepID=A0AA36LP75_YERMO|nr:Uncharacterised protein [Yersinia mollaretii]